MFQMSQKRLNIWAYI